MEQTQINMADCTECATSGKQKIYVHQCQYCKRGHLCFWCLKKGVCLPCRFLTTYRVLPVNVRHLKIVDFKSFLHGQAVSTEGKEDKEDLMRMCINYSNKILNAEKHAENKKASPSKTDKKKTNEPKRPKTRSQTQTEHNTEYPPLAPIYAQQQKSAYAQPPQPSGAAWGPEAARQRGRIVLPNKPFREINNTKKTLETPIDNTEEENALDQQTAETPTPAENVHKSPERTQNVPPAHAEDANRREMKQRSSPVPGRAERQPSRQDAPHAGAGARRRDPPRVDTAATHRTDKPELTQLKKTRKGSEVEVEDLPKDEDDVHRRVRIFAPPLAKDSKALFMFVNYVGAPERLPDTNEKKVDPAAQMRRAIHADKKRMKALRRDADADAGVASERDIERLPARALIPLIARLQAAEVDRRRYTEIEDLRARAKELWREEQERLQREAAVAADVERKRAERMRDNKRREREHAIAQEQAGIARAREAKEQKQRAAADAARERDPAPGRHAERAARPRDAGPCELGCEAMESDQVPSGNEDRTTHYSANTNYYYKNEHSKPSEIIECSELEAGIHARSMNILNHRSQQKEWNSSSHISTDNNWDDAKYHEEIRQASYNDQNQTPDFELWKLGTTAHAGGSHEKTMRSQNITETFSNTDLCNRNINSGHFRTNAPSGFTDKDYEVSGGNTYAVHSTSTVSPHQSPFGNATLGTQHSTNREEFHTETRSHEDLVTRTITVTRTVTCPSEPVHIHITNETRPARRPASEHDGTRAPCYSNAYDQSLRDSVEKNNYKFY